MNWKVLPPSIDLAVYQLPVYKTTSRFMATLGSPTQDANRCRPSSGSSVLVTSVRSSVAALRAKDLASGAWNKILAVAL